MSATASGVAVAATLPTNGRNVVRVTVSEYRGTKRLDIRVWRPVGTDYRATATGINLPLTQLELLRAALAKISGPSS